MQFPSIRNALSGAGATFRRFPLALLSGLAACGVAILMIDGPERDWMPRLLATSVMGIALFTAAGSSAERFRLATPRRWLRPDLGAPICSEWHDPHRLRPVRLHWCVPGTGHPRPQCERGGIAGVEPRWAGPHCRRCRRTAHDRKITAELS